MLNCVRANMLVSIIVPVYNASEYLKSCIDSVLNQSYKNFELILVDDGSTDGSFNICTMYAEKDERIKVLGQENKGPSAARNLGLEHARGEYIRFMDADDSIPEDSLRTLIKPVEDGIAGDLIIGSFSSNNKLYKERITGKYPISFFMDKFVPALTTFYYGVVWNKLYRLELIKKHRIKFDEAVDWSEDFLFNLIYYSHCRTIYYTDRSIYDYYCHDDSLSHDVKEYSYDKKYKMEILRYQGVKALIDKVKPVVELEIIAMDYLMFQVYWYLDAKLEGLFDVKSRMKQIAEILNNPIIEGVIYGEIYDPTRSAIKCLVYLIRRRYYGLISASFSLYHWLKQLMKRNRFMHSYATRLKKHYIGNFPL